MHGKAADVPAPRVLLVGFHDGFGPVGPALFAAARADGDLQHLVLLRLRRIVVANEVAEDLHPVEIVLGGHVAAAVPALIAEPEPGDFVRRRMPIRGALLLERGRLRGGHVLQPIGRLLGRTRAQVDRDVSRAANLVDEVHKFVRPKSVRLDHAAPVGIQPHGSLRADPVAPVIFVGEAASGPAHVRHLNRFQCGNHIVANAACIRNCGIGADPDPVVNAVPEMLGELPEKIAIDFRAGFGSVDRQFDFLCSHCRRGDSHNDQSDNGKKCTHGFRSMSSCRGHLFFPLLFRSAQDTKGVSPVRFVQGRL